MPDYYGFNHSGVFHCRANSVKAALGCRDEMPNSLDGFMPLQRSVWRAHPWPFLTQDGLRSRFSHPAMELEWREKIGGYKRRIPGLDHRHHALHARAGPAGQDDERAQMAPFLALIQQALKTHGEKQLEEPEIS